jgi:hypothetical protein
MQFRAIAIAAASLVAAQAQAITLPTGTKTLYVSGSSALTPAIRAIFVTNCVKKADGVTADFVEYKNVNSSGSADNFLFTCLLKTGTTLASKLGVTTAGTTIALFKRDAGGSAQGVNPLAKSTTTGFLQETSLTAPGTNASATFKQVAPDLGAADLEPAIFQETLNLGSNTPLTSAELGNLKTFPVLLQTFGIAVNNQLYVALQEAQGLTASNGQPSIPSTFIQSLVNTGGVALSADKTWGYLFGPTSTRATSLTQINICRRTAGSGTQAGANLLFSPFKEVPLTAVDTDAPLGNSGILHVEEAGSTGGVKTCLNNGDLASADAETFALGYIGYENKPSATDTWKFVKLDGYSADVANAQAGLYSYAFESTYNYNKNLTGTAKQFADAIITETANPAVIANLSADLRSAVVPVSASTATRAGNSRNPLKVVK